MERTRRDARRAMGRCIHCDQALTPASGTRCQQHLEAKRAADRTRAARKRENALHGDLLLRQTMECLRAEGITPPPELVTFCQQRGIDVSSP